MRWFVAFAIFALSFVALSRIIAAAQTPQAAAPSTSPAVLGPGTSIDSANVAVYTQYLPAAAALAVRHGLTIRVVPTRRLDWSTGFTQATEKYSPQVGLDKEDDITNYVAGAPFPAVDLTDPKAAVKIAYNWHMGPFMPDDFSLTPWGSFAYSEVAPNTIQPEDDYSYVCDQFSFLRFAHRTEVDPRPTLGSNSQGFEWKARCNEWTASVGGGTGEGSGIWVRFVDPHRGDEFYGFNAETRRIRRQASWDTVDQNCRGCHQPYWAYALPKTEEFTYRVLGTTSILACMTANEEPAGLVADAQTLSMGKEPFELRNAYILEMTPRTAGFSNLRILVFIDTEAFVWLAAEFFDGAERTEMAIPLWRSHPSAGGGNLFDLAGEFYMPEHQPVMATQAGTSGADQLHGPGHPDPNYPRWYFRSLIPAHGSFDQKINTGEIPEAIFNPQAIYR